jgi:hypothetical protein
MPNDLSPLFGKDTCAVVVYGHARGGTNILWNAIGSHENVLMTNNELNELFGRNLATRVMRKMPGLLRFSYINQSFQKIVISSVLRSLVMPVLGEKKPGELYTKEDYSSCLLCYKGVNLDIGCHDALRQLHGKIIPVILWRNPEAVINGHVRRGWSFDKSFRRYMDTLTRLQKIRRANPNTISVEFSTYISQPVAETKRIYQALGLSFAEKIMLRFKAKRRTGDSGHNVVAGFIENKHYWNTEDEVRTLIDVDINKRIETDLAALSSKDGFSSNNMAMAQSLYEEAL